MDCSFPGHPWNRPNTRVFFFAAIQQATHCVYVPRAPQAIFVPPKSTPIARLLIPDFQSKLFAKKSATNLYEAEYLSDACLMGSFFNWQHILVHAAIFTRLFNSQLLDFLLISLCNGWCQI